MIKTLDRASVTTVPFKTHKAWNVDTATQADILLLEQSGSDSGIIINDYYTSSLLAIEQQSYYSSFRVLEGLHISGTFFETSSIHWSSIDNPINWEGSYKGLVYDSVDHLFYRNQESPLTMFGLRIYKDVSYLGKRENRKINDRILTARLPIGYFGERILPNSVNVTDFSNFHDKYTISDDGHTNLILSGSNFVDVGVLSGIPNLSGSASYYNPIDERFGVSVSGDGAWVAVGSPMDENSLSFSKTGRAYLFKRTGSGYLGMQTLYSPFSQDALTAEQLASGSDDPLLLETEFGDFIISEGTSSCSGNDTPFGQLVDGFGRSVSLQGTHLAIGSPTSIVFPSGSTYVSTASACVTGSGLVFCYDMNFGGTESWGRINILSSSNDPAAEHEFGYTVSVYGDTLVVGAPGTGSIFIYNYTSSNWALSQTFTMNVTSSFGSAVSVCGDNLVVGNRNAAGKAWYYHRSGSSWYFVKELIGRTDFTGSIYTNGLNYTSSIDGFGHSVTVNDSFIAVGAPTDRIFTPSGSSNNYYAGLVYVYGLTGFACDQPFPHSGSYFSEASYPIPMQRIFSEDSIDNSYFGQSVSLNKTRLAIGSLKPRGSLQVEYSSSLYYVEGIEDEINDFDDTRFTDGFAYLYKLNSNRTEYLQEKIVRRNKERNVPYKHYGQAIHLSPQFMVVGSPLYTIPDLSGSLFSQSLYPTGAYIDQQQLRESASWAYDVGPNMSGSAFIYNLFDLSSEYQVGNVFYNQGTFVITTTGSQFQNILNNSGNRGFDLQYRGEHTIFEHEILISINPGEFNVSTNPSALVRDARIPLDINNDGVFDWIDVDLLLQWFNGMDANSSLSPETAMIVEALNLSHAPNVLTQEMIDYIETELSDTGVLDIDGSGGVDSRDGNMILYWWLGQLTPALLSSFMVPTSTRTNVKDIDTYLRGITGKNKPYPTKAQAETLQANNNLDLLPAYGIQNGELIKPDFFNYVESSSLDRTGSYLAPYITTIGLYNGLDLVGVAKMGRPVKNMIQYPLNFIVRFDFG
jgi:hypothetical protein